MDRSFTSQKNSQPGLSYISHSAAFITVFLNEEVKQEGRAGEMDAFLCDTIDKINSHAGELEEMKLGSGDNRQTAESATGILDTVIFGVNPMLWKMWRKALGKPVCRELEEEEGVQRVGKILECSPPYKNTGGDLYFHVKSDNPDDCDKIAGKIEKYFKDVVDRIETTYGNHKRNGHVYGRRMLHGLISSVDPVNFSSRVLIDDGDEAHRGACFGLSQKFVHNWSLIGELSEVDIENMIGRDFKGNILPQLEKQSHLRAVRVKGKSGVNHRVYTQGQPFGNSDVAPNCEEGVFVSAFAKSTEAFHDTLSGMLGESYGEMGEIQDRHLRYSTSTEGNLWYIPSVTELGLNPEKRLKPVEINSFFKIKSKSPYMYYNTKDYLNSIWEDRNRDPYPVTDRVITLLGDTFSRWHHTWYVPPVFPVLPDMEAFLGENEEKYSKEEARAFLTSSIAERKGLAIKFTLGDLFTDEAFCRETEMFRIDPKEVIVGVLPPYTLGTGPAVMTYLGPDERLDGFCMGLDETSTAGHTIPDYPRLLEKGVKKLIDEVGEKMEKAEAEGDRNEEKQKEANFFRSVKYSLEGVRDYFLGYGRLAEETLERRPEIDPAEKENLKGIAKRMRRLAEEPPESFVDALQMIFGFHCCMHLAGEMSSIGRLDKWLEPFFDGATVSEKEAQEAMDCFWIKMDEKVLMNRHYYEEGRSFGTCALPYTGGPVPVGNKLSQWVMQVTVGGFDCRGENDPDAVFNEVTRMCLRSARRLPLNAPCLSLRVSESTPEYLLEEAGRAILSGGAAPFVFNDRKIVDGLMKSGEGMDEKDAVNYCADGCWENVLPGQTELGLSYIVLTNALEMALNQGATYINAGPTYIRGSQLSFVSPKASEIKTYEELEDLFIEHYKWMTVSFFSGIFQRYGNLNKICPSPLLSAFTQGCLESGRDFTDGGAKYHMLAPMLFGVTAVVDSLWAIKTMVFNGETAVTDLNELTTCLICDWGHELLTPFECSRGGEERRAINSRRFMDLRETALSLPKFGSGNEEVDKFAGRLASRIKAVPFAIMNDPEKEVSRAFAAGYERLKEKYRLPGREFSFHLIPAFGTFEDYIGLGLSNGASADGRRKGGSLCSNFSPMSSPEDLPVQAGARDIFECLKGWNNDEFREALEIQAPLDINVPENFPLEDLVTLLKKFIKGELGSNLLTVTAADIETMEQAQKFPECYDLVRMRMGGWSEFFISMYDAQQDQHLRRPIYNVGGRT